MILRPLSCSISVHFEGRLATVGFQKPRERMVWWMRDTLERPAMSCAWYTLVNGSAL